MLELAGPLEEYPVREAGLADHGGLGFLDQLRGIAIPGTQANVIAQQAILTLDGGRPLGDLDLCDLGERNLASMRILRKAARGFAWTCGGPMGRDHEIPNRFFVLAMGPGVSNDDRMPFSTLDDR